MIVDTGHWKDWLWVGITIFRLIVSVVLVITLFWYKDTFIEAAAKDTELAGLILSVQLWVVVIIFAIMFILPGRLHDS